MPPIKTPTAPVAAETTKATPKAAPVKGTKTTKATNGDAKESAPVKGTKAPKKAEAKEAKATEEVSHTEILYPDVSIKKCQGESSLTEEKAKKILGWDSENVNDKNYLLSDMEGKKVRCHHNPTNRPFVYNLAKTWASEILHKRWRLNGETIIVSKTGLVLSGQHRLTGLVLAVQEYKKDPEKWEAYWKAEPTMETIIVFGISDEDDTVNTIDTGKPRSLSDVIFRSHYFNNVPPGERQTLALMSKSAIGLMWHRTGAQIDAWSPSKRTHGESLEFLDNHPRLLECLKHIYQEEGGGGKEGIKISKLLHPGYAAGLLYLQATANSDSEKYNADKNERSLNWDLWGKACDFWVMLAQGAKEFTEVRKAYQSIWEVAGRTTQDESLAILSKAWNCYVKGKRISPSDVKLEYVTDDDGKKKLAECPTVGGIDRGNPEDDDEPDAIINDGDDVAPTPAEIKRRSKSEGAKATVAKGPIDEKQTVYVCDPKSPKEGDYLAEVTKIYSTQKDKMASVKVANGHPFAGKVYEVPFKWLSRTPRGTNES